MDLSMVRRALGTCLAATLCIAPGFLTAPACGAEVHVMISGGYAATLAELAPAFEAETGNKIVMVKGPSMGDTPEAIPNRIKRGEPADMLIMVGTAIDGLIRDGKALADTRADLAVSGIAVAVRAGTPHPDISTLDAFRKSMLAAQSIAYSDSASGVYLSTVLFPRLGIWETVKDRCHMIPAEPVGAVVARGDAQIGMQQMSELKPIAGIEIVGPLPEGAQKYTTFTGVVTSFAKEPAAARALLKFLASSPGAEATAVKNGMRPARK